MKELKDFIEEAERFKKDPRYQTMPPELRDFFNEEMGRFKFALELSDEKEREDMCTSFRSRKIKAITENEQSKNENHT